MPPGMIISNGMGGFIQYPQTISPFGAMQFSQAGAHQLAQMGQMQMILQPAMNIRHVSIKILCTYLWCLTHKISWKDHIPWVIWLKQRKIKQNLLLDFRKKDFRIVFPYLYDSFGLTWFVSPPQPPPPLEGHRELNNRFVSNIFFSFLLKTCWFLIYRQNRLVAHPSRGLEVSLEVKVPDSVTNQEPVKLKRRNPHLPREDVPD